MEYQVDVPMADTEVAFGDVSSSVFFCSRRCAATWLGYPSPSELTLRYNTLPCRTVTQRWILSGEDPFVFTGASLGLILMSIHRTFTLAGMYGFPSKCRV